MPTVVLVHTIREGKDPDDFWHAITSDLADELELRDPWIRLGKAENAHDARIVVAYAGSRTGALREANMKGYAVEGEDIFAVGY